MSRRETANFPSCPNCSLKSLNLLHIFPDNLIIQPGIIQVIAPYGKGDQQDKRNGRTYNACDCHSLACPFLYLQNAKHNGNNCQRDASTPQAAGNQRKDPAYHGRNPKPHAGRTVIRAIIWLIPLLPIVALLSVISLLAVIVLLPMIPLLAVIVLLPAVPLLVTVILLPVISLLVLWLPAIALLVSRLLFFLRIIAKHVIFAFHEKSPFTGYFGTSPAAPPYHGSLLHTGDCANYP